MTVFELNCSALAKKSPELAERLARSRGGLVFPKRARSGALTAYKERTSSQSIVWLHSSYDPEGEACRIVQASISAGTETVAVIGMGLGYTVRELLREQCQVVVLEPDITLVRSCLELTDMQDLFLHPSLFVLAEPDYETLMHFFQVLDPRAITILENPAYTNLYPEQCSLYASVIRKFMEKDTINKQTVKRFGRRWVRNIVKNLLELETFTPLEAYSDCMAGLPVIVLAAGPSLDAVLPYINELKIRAVLVAVDTACKSLFIHGCVPDFVVVADPQYWNARHLDWAVFPEARLVTEIAVWPSVFHYRWKDIVLAASQYPLGKYIELSLSLNLGALRAGGSVATSAWDFARKLGAKKIYMAGLDLSYPGEKSHAAASTFEQAALYSQCRIQPAATAFFSAVNNANPYFVNNYAGGKVKTDKRLSLYAWWFSRMCALFPEPPTRNLSVHGYYIPEMPSADMDEILALPVLRDEIEARFNNLKISRLQIPSAALLEDLLHNLQELSALLARGIAALDEGLDGTKPIQSVLKTLDSIESVLLTSSAKDLVGFLLPDLNEKLGPKPQTLEESFLVTKQLYHDIAESVLWHIEIMKHFRGAPV